MGKRTSLFTRYGRKEVIMRRYGSIKNFYDMALPFLDGIVTNAQYLSRVLDNHPCSPEQADAVEAAVDYFLDKPQRIIADMVKTAERGKRVHTIEVGDVACLQAAMRCGTGDSEEKELP